MKKVCSYCGNVFDGRACDEYCSYHCCYRSANRRASEQRRKERNKRYLEIERRIEQFGSHIAQIPGHEQYYVTDDGRVFSTHRGYWKEKAQVLNRGRYLYVNLEDKQYKVHQLVLVAFGYERPEGQEVRHLNGISTDNRLENLCWGSRAENETDKQKHGRVPRGESHVSSGIPDVVIREVVGRARKGETLKALSKEYGVSAASICRWNSGKIRHTAFEN